MGFIDEWIISVQPKENKKIVENPQMKAFLKELDEVFNEKLMEVVATGLINPLHMGNPYFKRYRVSFEEHVLKLVDVGLPDNDRYISPEVISIKSDIESGVFEINRTWMVNAYYRGEPWIYGLSGD